MNKVTIVAIGKRLPYNTNHNIGRTIITICRAMYEDQWYTERWFYRYIGHTILPKEDVKEA